MQNPILTVIYSHGRYGSPWYGFKIETLRLVALAKGVNILSIRYTEDMSVEAMEEKLLRLVKDDVAVPGDLAFLSSSRGAYVSTRIARRVIEHFASEEVRVDDDKVLPRRHLLGQFLIAPAFYIKPDYYPDQDPDPAGIQTTIVHGLDDTVISCESSIAFARKFKAHLHLVEGGHRLNSQRDRLCLLFGSFLADRLGEADRFFDEFKREHAQPDSQPDGEGPGGRGR